MTFYSREAATCNSLGRKPQVLGSRNAMRLRRRNSKFEIRNPKQIQNPNEKGSKQSGSPRFGHWRFVFPICFEFRNSDFGFSPRSAAKRTAFTLLEVILALAILAGALAVLGEVSRLALRNATAARDLARAQLLAESKLSEIQAGMTSPDSVDNSAFDTSSDSPDSAEPGWLYSISSQPTDETGLISVRVTVTRDLPAGQHPVKFSLVRWMPDPNYTYTPPSSDTSTTSSSSGTGGS